MATFHPAWVIFPVLVAWLAARGEMGSDFNGPFLVLLTLGFAGHFVSRGRNATGAALIGRWLLGTVLGLLASALLLWLTFSIAYECEGGANVFESACGPRRATLDWLAIAVGALAVARVILAVAARRHVTAAGPPGGDR